MLMNAIMCRFAGIIGAMIIWKQHRAYGNGTILHGQSALLKPHFSWISRTSFERLLRSVKTEEDAPTHTIQYGLENEIKVKKEMMIFLMLARFHDNIIQSSKNQWASFLKKKDISLALKLKKIWRKMQKCTFFPEKLVYCRINEKIISTCTT